MILIAIEENYCTMQAYAATHMIDVLVNWRYNSVPSAKSDGFGIHYFYFP